jgi:hypothetical protein
MDGYIRKHTTVLSKLGAGPVAREFVKKTHSNRVEILADRKIGKDTFVRYLVNGLEQSRSGRLGYEVTDDDDLDLASGSPDHSHEARSDASS